MDKPFDAIVVGAGPAGATCAYSMAMAGLEVLLVERGRFPGAKNMWGGAYYGPAMAELFPDFFEAAPYERYVGCHKVSMLSEKASLSVEFAAQSFSERPYNGIILLRSKFDRWLSGQAEKAGAVLASGLEAEGLVKSGGRVVGIKAGGDEIGAHVVVACDGVNSVLAREAGLREELRPRYVKQGVKEIIQLSPKEIEARFNLDEKEGVAWEFFGSFTKGVPGGGFIYTNKDSLSVGVVAQLEGLVERKKTINALLDEFKCHPLVARLIDGGKLAEYSAHLIPLPAVCPSRLYTDGMLVAGDAASLVLATGLILEGANLAVASGVAAARAVIRAKERNDFSAGSLSHYQSLLEDGFVLKDLRTFAGSVAFLESPRIYDVYPEMACAFAERIFTSDGKPRKHAWRLFRETMRGRISMARLASDFLKGIGSL